MDFFTIRVMCRNFLNLYGRYVLQYKSFLTIFSLQTQQIEIRLVAIKQVSKYPLSFFANAPFNSNKSWIKVNLMEAVNFILSIPING